MWHRFPGIRLLLWSLLFHAVTGIPVWAHVEHSKEQPEIGLQEKLGQSVPLHLEFFDEDGKKIQLKELIRGPTILAPVYYHCPNVCNFLLQNIAGALGKLPAVPGKEYVVLAISFDETEKAPLATERKRIYLQMIGKPFPPEAWRFLTGDTENIHQLTDAVGFRFRKEGSDFQHPVALVILSQEGKIIRYLYGTDILPFDLKMALLEASEGRVGPTVSKVMRFCFSFDPKGRRYVFNTLKVTGIATITFALLFILFLTVKGGKRRREEVH
jgi:protein SCO1/2